MIVRKPYAFIIKYIKLLHLVLLIPAIYLIVKTSSIVQFFSDYVSNGYLILNNLMLSNIANNYINIFMFVCIVFIILMLIIFMNILKRKNKPINFYKVNIIYYLVLFILLMSSLSIFGKIETDTLESGLANIIKDVISIIYYSEYVFAFLLLLRSIGFNIKKFNFKNDIFDLKIEAEDYEEYEIFRSKDNYEKKRTFKRLVRESKYYFKENKFMFLVLFIILIIGGSLFLFLKKEVIEREYRENEIVSFGYLNFNIKESFVSSLTYNGNVINKDKSYVIVALEINNRYREVKDFNYTDLQLVINNKYFTPDISLANYFKDIGNPYNGSKIVGNSNNKYILVYEIDKYLISSKYKLSIYSRYDTEQKNIVSKNVVIKPKILNNNIIENKVNMGTNIDLKNTNLKNTTGTLLNYNFTNRYEYTYKKCLKNNDCYDYKDAITLNYNTNGSKNTLLVLDYILNLDNESSYMYSNKTYKNFFEDFMKIKYVLNGKEFIIDTHVRNNINYNEKLIIEVPKEVKEAEIIEALITVRNVSYSIKLK
ncbi:MAG: hypothetical protein E7163_05445 [Firmicutes bacterium]|nr:hypothetical protein [Bacillota bacterium]